jgi:hypothetical protein
MKKSDIGVVQIRLIGRPEYVEKIAQQIARIVSLPEGWKALTKTNNPKYQNSNNIRFVGDAIVEVEMK